MSRPIATVASGFAPVTPSSAVETPISSSHAPLLRNGAVNLMHKVQPSIQSPSQPRSPRLVLPPPPHESRRLTRHNARRDNDKHDREKRSTDHFSQQSPVTLDSPSQQSPPILRKAGHERHSSLDSIALVADGGATSELLRDVVQERAKVVDKRVNIKQQQKDLASQLPLHREAYAAMMETLRTALPEVLHSKLSTKTKKLLDKDWFNFDNFSKTLENWQERLDQEQNDLYKWEGKLYAKEDELYKRLCSINPKLTMENLDVFSDTFIPPSLLQHSSRRSSCSSTTSPEESDYYRAIGKINLLRDEIFNFESQFRMDQHQRYASRGPDRAEELSEQRFISDYFEKREAIVRRYVEAKADMENLAQSCHERGLAIEPPNLPPFLDQMFINEPDIFLDTEHDSRRGTRNMDARIVRWIRHVLRSSVSEAVDIAEPLTTSSIETSYTLAGASTFSHFHRLPASEDHDIDALMLHYTHHTPNFESEMGLNRRRSSAPDLRHTRARTRSKTRDYDVLVPKICKKCLDEERPQSIC